MLVFGPPSSLRHLIPGGPLWFLHSPSPPDFCLIESLHFPLSCPPTPTAPIYTLILPWANHVHSHQTAFPTPLPSLLPRPGSPLPPGTTLHLQNGVQLQSTAGTSLRDLPNPLNVTDLSHFSHSMRHELLSLPHGLCSFFFFNWDIVLQCCVSFCCTMKWISYIYAYIPSLLHLPPHPPAIPPI